MATTVAKYIKINGVEESISRKYEDYNSCRNQTIDFVCCGYNSANEALVKWILRNFNWLRLDIELGRLPSNRMTLRDMVYWPDRAGEGVEGLIFVKCQVQRIIFGYSLIDLFWWFRVGLQKPPSPAFHALFIIEFEVLQRYMTDKSNNFTHLTVGGRGVVTGWSGFTTVRPASAKMEKNFLLSTSSW